MVHRDDRLKPEGAQLSSNGQFQVFEDDRRGWICGIGRRPSQSNLPRNC